MMIVLIIFLVFFYFLINKLLTNDYGCPSNIYMYFWVMSILISLIYFPLNMPNSYYSYIYILFTGIIFTISNKFGEELAFKIKKVNSKQKSFEIHICKIGWKIVLITTFLAMFRSIYELISYGTSVRALFDFNELLDVNAMMAQNRYNGNNSSNILLKILMPFVYFAPLAGGYVYNFALNNIHKFLSIITILPILVSALITNAKAGLIASIALWISGFFASSLQTQQKILKKLNFKVIINIIIFIFIFSFTNQLSNVYI